MSNTMVLVDREALLVELQTVFDSQTADTLLSVLDKVAAQVYAAGVTREDFSELKQIVADLAEEQRKLAEEQRKLVEAQRETENRLFRLERAIETLTEQVRGLISSQQQLVTDVGDLKGRMLEITYRNKVAAYFGRLLRRPKVVDLTNLLDTLETLLSQEDFNEVLLIDLIVQGKPRNQPDIGDVLLAVEVSSVVDLNDVKRAWKRAELLRKAGYLAIPVVAGESKTLRAEKEAHEQKVVMLQDGRNTLWDEALATWIKR
jgi:hypothetical protein